MKKALITGITGQDGSYLAEFLVQKGYDVYGVVRRSSTFNRKNIDHLFKDTLLRDTHLLYGDMTDMHSLLSILRDVQPDEIYNLAAQSHVKVSFEIPFYTAQSDAIGVLGLLEAVRAACPKAKVYQASTSEMFSGDPKESPQSEQTPFMPRSPYGAAKLYGFQIARVYRESYGMFVTNGILFNHESPRRGENFVSRKIVLAAVDIKRGLRDMLFLGNMNAKRDWGYAPEYMEAAWRMLQQDTPGDYVIATGETHTVREFVEAVFAYIGMPIRWEGTGTDEKGISIETGKVLVAVDPSYFRPNEVDHLCGDSTKARKVLDWTPTVTFDRLVEIMVDAEMEKYFERKRV